MEFIATAALSSLPFVHPSNQNLSVTLYARNVSRLVSFRLLITNFRSDYVHENTSMGITFQT